MFLNEIPHAEDSVVVTGIEIGQRYVACFGPDKPAQILTCLYYNRIKGWVMPAEDAFSYDSKMCFKILPTLMPHEIKNMAEKADTDYMRWNQLGLAHLKLVI